MGKKKKRNTKITQITSCCLSSLCATSVWKKIPVQCWHFTERNKTLAIKKTKYYFIDFPVHLVSNILMKNNSKNINFWLSLELSLQLAFLFYTIALFYKVVGLLKWTETFKKRGKTSWFSNQLSLQSEQLDLLLLFFLSFLLEAAGVHDTLMKY